MEKKILCFGLVMADVLINGMEKMPDDWEQTVGGDESFLCVGGGATNSARTFAKLGYNVDLLGRVGNDYFGKYIKEECIVDNVNCDKLIIDDEKSTGIAIGFIHTSGQRCFVTAQGANRNININDFSKVDFSEYDYMHINGYFQYPNIEKDMRNILEGFKENDITVSLDTAGSDPSGRWFETIEHFVDLLDYVFLNDTQIKKMAKTDDIDNAAAFLLEKGAKKVVVKNGAEGCVIYQKATEKIVVPTKKYDVVDTTGAGDSFDAAYIIGLKNGWNDKKSAKFANMIAGRNCCYFGATAGVMNWEEAMAEFMEVYDENV